MTTHKLSPFYMVIEKQYTLQLGYDDKDPEVFTYQFSATKGKC